MEEVFFQYFSCKNTTCFDFHLICCNIISFHWLLSLDLFWPLHNTGFFQLKNLLKLTAPSLEHTPLSRWWIVFINDVDPMQLYLSQQKILDGQHGQWHGRLKGQQHLLHQFSKHVFCRTGPFLHSKKWEQKNMHNRKVLFCSEARSYGLRFVWLNCCNRCRIDK